MKINNLAARPGRQNTPNKPLTNTPEQLASGAHRAAQPGRARRVHRGLRRAQRPARRDRADVAGRDHPNVYRPLLRYRGYADTAALTGPAGQVWARVVGIILAG